MLASSAPDIAAALAETGPASVEYKLDGIRIQVHKAGSDVAVFTRNLNDITHRAHTIVSAVESDAGPSARPRRRGARLGPPLLRSAPRRRSATCSNTRSPSASDFWPGSRAPIGYRPSLTDDPADAQRHLDDALSAGHEGAIVKGLERPTRRVPAARAGRRSSRCTRWTSSFSAPNGDTVDAKAGCPTCTSAPSTSPAASSSWSERRSKV